MLDQRLRAATDDVRAALADTAPPPFDEAVAAEDRTVAYPRVGWRGPLIALGTAAAMLLVVATAALLLRGDGISTEPAATELDSVSTPPSTTIGVESLEWSRAPLSEDVIGVRLDKDVKRPDRGFGFTSVTAGGPGYVAVGYQICEGTTACRADAAVWISPDGSNWARIQDNPELWEGEGLRSMEDVTSDGSRLVAVGVGFDEPGVYGLAAAVWTSPDGTDWTRVPHDPDVFGGIDSSRVGSQGWMRGVVAGGPGFVAVGNDRGRAAVWTSADGASWTRLPHDPEIFGLGNYSSIEGVISTEAGLLAWGTLNGTGAVWMSADGMAWSVFPTGLSMNGVATGGPGFVAVGTHETTETGCHANAVGDCHAVVWTSPDAVTWTPVEHDELIFGSAADKQSMHDVIAVGSDLVAVGTSVWVSPDGFTWSRVHDLQLTGAEQNGMRRVTIGPSALVAVGESELAAIWTTQPTATSNEATHEPEEATVPNTASDYPSVLDLGPGVWQRVAAGEDWVQSIIDIESLPDGGFVALTAESGPRTVMWSPDGVDWYEGDPHDALTRLNHRMLVVGGQVVLQEGFRFWSLDPKTGQVEEISLDTSGLEGALAPRAKAASDDEILFVGQDRTADAVVVWLIRPSTGRSELAAIVDVDEGLADHFTPDIRAGRVDDRWVITTDIAAFEGYVGDEYVSSSRSVMWVSEDAEQWSEIPLPEDPAGIQAQGSAGLYFQSGPMAGDLWYTSDLTEWVHLIDEGQPTGESQPPFSPIPADSGYLGVVDVDPGGPGEFWVTASSDGTTWEPKTRLPEGLLSNELEAYSDGRLVAGLVGRSGTELWLWDGT